MLAVTMTLPAVTLMILMADLLHPALAAMSVLISSRMEVLSSEMDPSSVTCTCNASDESPPTRVDMGVCAHARTNQPVHTRVRMHKHASAHLLAHPSTT